MTSRALVIEAGGTTTRVTAFDPACETGGNWVRVPTPNYLGGNRDHAATLDSLFGTISRVATQLLAGGAPDIVVMAYAGPVSEDGVALRSPTILGPECVVSVNVREQLARLWPAARIRVINDLTAAGYFFVQRGHRDFCVITVGSGIGNKVFLGGRPQIGPRGFGGEIGHLRTRPRPGSPVADIERDLGEISSGRGTVWMARSWLEREPPDVSGSMLASLTADADDDTWSRTLAHAFVHDDPLATRVVEATAHPLAGAIAALHLNLGLERFFIVGGFARALGTRYRAQLCRLADQACWHLGQRWHEMIQVSAIDSEEEGLAGACHLARTLAAHSQPPSMEAA